MMEITFHVASRRKMIEMESQLTISKSYPVLFVHRYTSGIVGAYILLVSIRYRRNCAVHV